jgi:DNA repair exonuclease SbcCD ATPase subunit
MNINERLKLLQEQKQKSAETSVSAARERLKERKAAYSAVVSELEKIRADIESTSIARLDVDDHSAKILVDGKQYIARVDAYISANYYIEIATTFLSERYVVYFGIKERGEEREQFSDLESAITFVLHKYAEYLAVSTNG